MTRLAPRLPFTNGPTAAPMIVPKRFQLTTGPSRKSHRILLYGTGGIGKSSLASLAPEPVFADLDRGSEDFEAARVSNIDSWQDLRMWLSSWDFSPYRTVIVDTVTAAEELCRLHVVGNYKTDKGNAVTSIEGFGWGKGYKFMFEEWKKFLADLERLYSAGKNIVLVAHERTGKVPNPNGEDWTRYEPRLLDNTQVSIMHGTKEWCDHVLFVSYDVVAVEGKAKGSGTRTIYSQETPTYMAKTRKLPPTPIPFQRGSTTLWDMLLESPAQEGPPE